MLQVVLMLHRAGLCYHNSSLCLDEREEGEEKKYVE